MTINDDFMDCHEEAFDLLGELFGELLRRRLIYRMLEGLENSIMENEDVVKALAEWKRARDTECEKREAAADVLEKALATRAIKLLP